MSVIKVTSADQLNEQINSGKLVIVDFFATWCGPCKRIAPEIETLAGEETGVVFMKIDVDELETVAAKYEVSAMPTFLFFKNGAKVAEVVGASMKNIKEKLNQLK
mmetsp:Transcript_76071/g.114534  ORF Transcript_76071/g.114534 Transcript_76071/m.114534 type:complete len:105 (+) Transcript_76071:48-362(+)|eukprot:CAMPEP_0117040140 /NCGR_PEP_ID=MMETSP0472-20121206/28113_1 /TAXON_ID=693140 ORGANISM="Tiarina fusus, Strain LIS" /NCGR_SAMPLE_ID=MMETSP0472 /ASSEMBLY_ACC=CAM_ASM_000603 /LENGTH=104 /DNA_ID=CAMNT_0004750797 /DNA_START=33 /DNA_END=347 /DNA_ORIENTATION=+